MTTIIEVTEFTDPGCVWSWSSEPKLRWLRHHYGEQVAWRRVLGIQVDDLKLSFPDRDAVDSAEAWRGDWLAVAAHSGAPITSRLEWMLTSSWPASKAAKAAEAQGEEVAEAVLRRLCEAVFVEGRPADSHERIALALRGVADLDLEWLLDDIESRAVTDALEEDFEETRRPHPHVIGLREDGPHPGAAKAEARGVRYAFPTLIVNGPEGERVLRSFLDADAALGRYLSLTAGDLQLLTGVAEPPEGAVEVATATARLWLDPVEAERRSVDAATISPRR
jgi:predicted DsbA family dithiol-disulfide isomerase